MNAPIGSPINKSINIPTTNVPTKGIIKIGITELITFGTFIFLRLYREKIENSYQKAFSIEEKSYVSLLELIKRR